MSEGYRFGLRENPIHADPSTQFQEKKKKKDPPWTHMKRFPQQVLEKRRILNHHIRYKTGTEPVGEGEKKD